MKRAAAKGEKRTASSQSKPGTLLKTRRKANIVISKAELNRQQKPMKNGAVQIVIDDDPVPSNKKKSMPSKGKPSSQKKRDVK